MNEWIRLADTCAALDSNYHHLKSHLPVYLKLHQWLAIRTAVISSNQLLVPQLHVSGYFEIYPLELDKYVVRLAPELGSNVVVKISDAPYGNYAIPPSFKVSARAAGFKEIPKLVGELMAFPANAPVLWNTWVRSDDIQEFCITFGIKDFDVRLENIESSRAAGEEALDEEREQIIESQKCDHEGKIQKLQRVISNLEEENRLLKEQAMQETSTQGVNAIIKTTRAMATLLLEDGSGIGEEPTTPQLRALMSKLEGIDGAPTAIKTLKKHLKLR